VQNKWFWLVAGFVVAMLVGFNANPSPQPQRVSDLVARIETLEEENGNQQEMLEALSARLDRLEEMGVEGAAFVFDEDVTIPEGWVEDESSDGILRYWHDEGWQLTSDEPGTMDLWLDEDTAIFFTWDWAADLLNDLHDDEDFFRFFEEDLVWSDETLQMDTVESGEVEFMGEESHYWDISVERADGYSSRMLTIFYPCNDRASCNVTFVRFDPDPEDGEAVREFSREDWEFVHTFANGIEFLTEGEATVTANANLRTCPATSCEIVGRLVRGEIVDVVAMSEDGLWYQLESGEWIAAGLVYGAAEDLPVIRDNEDI
jgi:hypothetical protein